MLFRSYPSSSEPDSILPVLNGRVDSEGGSENTTNLGGSDSDESDFESKVQNAFAPSKEVMMTQPAVPPKDEEARKEKDNPPPVAGDAKATAPKEAADAEVKANEAPSAKKAMEQDNAEKKKAAKKAARDAADPPKIFDKGEPSARPPACVWTDKDELDLLKKPIEKGESPQMLELRRIALVNQSANLVNAHKQLKKLADEEEFKRHPERISANNKRTQRRLKELEDDDVDPAIRRINAIRTPPTWT